MNTLLIGYQRLPRQWPSSVVVVLVVLLVGAVAVGWRWPTPGPPPTPETKEKGPPPWWVGPWMSDAPPPQDRDAKPLALTLVSSGRGELTEYQGPTARGLAVCIEETLGDQALLSLHGKRGSWLLAFDVPEQGCMTLYQLNRLPWGQHYQLAPLPPGGGQQTAVYPHDLTQHTRVAVLRRPDTKGGGR
jgi:hypothetical protein